MTRMRLASSVTALWLVVGWASGCSRGDTSTDDGRDPESIERPAEDDGRLTAGDDAIDLIPGTGGSGGSGAGAPDAAVASDAGASVLERCGDGMDDDGDGLADDGCACTTGAKQRCYAGPMAIGGVGNCDFGTQVCDTSGEFAVWGECQDWVAPEPEECNEQDDDCDALIDEGCECKIGFHRDCFEGDDLKLGVGQCKAGSQTCDAGAWGECEGQVLPSDEECDGLDNNCNGQVDEGCDCDEGAQRDCFSGDPELLGVGECHAGAQTCDGTSWGACVGQVLPVDETCDGKDNDCDRHFDEVTGCDEVPPAPGTDIVVFNDINVFDNDSMVAPDNPTLVVNLVDYTTAGERGDADTVWLDYGHGSQCFNTNECNSTRMATMYSTMGAAGYTVMEVTAPYTDIPADVKVIILWNPLEAYTLDEINMYKAFAAEGGRLVFIGEHDAYYTGFEVENGFLLNMGAVMTNVGGQIDCSYFDVPQASIRPHQITAGIGSIRVACSSQIVLGPNDYPLYYDTTNMFVLSGVATIDTTPSTVLLQP